MRFNHKESPVLHLISRHKSIGACVAYEPEMPESVDGLQQMYKDKGLTVEQARTLKATNTELFNQIDVIAKTKWPTLVKDMNSFINQRDKFFTDNRRIIWKNTELDLVNHSVPPGSPVDQAIDRIMDCQTPPVYYMPAATCQATDAIRKSIKDRANKLWSEMPDTTGIVVFGDDEAVSFVRTVIAYDICDGYITILYIYWFPDEPGRPAEIGDVVSGNANVLYIHSHDMEDPLVVEKVTPVYSDTFATILLRLIIIQFFQMETETINQPNPHLDRYESSLLGEQKVQTKLNLPINVVNATWFRGIDRDVPFLVSGHWRQQRKGPGRGEIEVIYIKPFKKSGYHRKPRTLGGLTEDTQAKE